MSVQIWRFPIGACKRTEIEMPKGAVILCVQAKDGEPNLWAEVNTDSPKEKRMFEIFGTGHDMPSGMGVHRKYIGTFQVGSMIGTMVFHVYERLN